MAKNLKHLLRLKEYADQEGVTMAELGRRGAIKKASLAKKAKPYSAIAKRHSDEDISKQWWNQ